MRAPWWKFAMIGTGLYLTAFAAASIYPLVDRRTFSGLIAVLLGWPWIDYFPSAWLPAAIAFNAAIIFVCLAGLSGAATFLRRTKR